MDAEMRDDDIWDVDIDPSDEEPTEPQDEDITTGNHRDFYQNGALILTVTDDQNWETEVKEYMDACKFWPNVWFISDHGDCHLLTID